CLHEAAVLGPVFDPVLFHAVVGEPVDETIFAGLSEAELIEEVRDASTRGMAPRERPYRFVHALVHEVVYRNLLLSRRTELHGRVGRALERLRGTRPDRLEDLEMLGHHFGLSDDRQRGARYLVAAADWARGIYANDDAIRHYQQALRILGDCDVGEDETVDIR